MEKLVSIVIPCYNHEKYIDDCMASMMAQTYPAMEIIIVDDASDDNSFEKLKKWEQKLCNRFKRVVIRRNETNQGITKNLNDMLRLCRGAYIKPMASDDMLFPDAVTALASFAEKSDADIIFSNTASVENSFCYGQLEKRRFTYHFKQNPPQGRGLTGRLCAGNYIPAPGILVPYRTYEKYGFYNEDFLFEDWEYLLRVSTKGTIRYLNKPTALYRTGQHSLSHFGKGDEEKQRHRLFHEHKKKMLQLYKEYADKGQMAEFYNTEAVSAMNMDDRELVSQILAEMQEEGLAVSANNRLRLLLMKLHVYLPLKKIKEALWMRVK